LSSHHVAPHLLVIHHLAGSTTASSGSRGDMWCDDSSILMKEFRNHYLNSYAALPSSTHIAESNVKDANFCQIKGRGKGLSSAFSTARSSLVESINRLAKEQFKKKQTYKGNAKVSGGKAKERKNKSDNTDFDSEECKLNRVRGQIRSQVAIKFIMSRHEQIEKVFNKAPGKKRKWMDINEHISDNKEQFSTKRVGVKLENFNNNKDKNKPKNKLQKRTGIHVCPMVLGRILYSKLKKDRDTEDIKKELVCRELPTDGGWQKQLMVRLKNDEKDTKSFKPKHPDLADTMFDRIILADLEIDEEDE
jgi:hypothetical protein